MTGFNHGLAGAIIALTVKQPILAISLAFASHYLLDTLPHRGFSKEQVLGPRFNRLVKIDFVFSLFLMALLALVFPNHVLIIWACMIAAAVPDTAFYFNRRTVKRWPDGLDKFTSFHWHLNNHVKPFYFDILYFILMSLAILLIRI